MGASKKSKTFELIPEQNFFGKVDELLNNSEALESRHGQKLIPFPRMLELDVQERIERQLLQEKKENKRNLIRVFETAKKAEQKYQQYYKDFVTEGRNYDKHSGKHRMDLLWEHFLDCRELMLDAHGKKMDSFDPRYQIADGKRPKDKGVVKPLNRNLITKTIGAKNRTGLQDKIAHYEVAIEKITEEIKNIVGRLEEIQKKKDQEVARQWAEYDQKNPQENDVYFEDQMTDPNRE